MNSIRPRRLRENENIRKLTRETRVSASSLVLPVFIKEGSGIKEEIKSLEGHYYYSPDNVPYAIEDALNYGVRSVLIFGIPKEKRCSCQRCLCRKWCCTAGNKSNKNPFP